MTISVTQDYISTNDSVTGNNALWVSGCGHIRLASEHMPEGTEKGNNKKPVSPQRFEPVTS
jgi:hypothetical protein